MLRHYLTDLFASLTIQDLVSLLLQRSYYIIFYPEKRADGDDLMLPNQSFAAAYYVSLLKAKTHSLYLKENGVSCR